MSEVPDAKNCASEDGSSIRTAAGVQDRWLFSAAVFDIGIEWLQQRCY